MAYQMQIQTQFCKNVAALNGTQPKYLNQLYSVCAEYADSIPQACGPACKFISR